PPAVDERQFRWGASASGKRRRSQGVPGCASDARPADAPPAHPQRTAQASASNPPGRLRAAPGPNLGLGTGAAWGSGPGAGGAGAVAAGVPATGERLDPQSGSPGAGPDPV